MKAKLATWVATFQVACRRSDTHVWRGCCRGVQPIRPTVGCPPRTLAPLYRALVNDDSVTERLRGAFEATFGPQRVATPPRIMGGEDFSAYLAVRPGTFFFVGARPPAPAVAYPHHHPRFAIDEAALPVAVEAFLTAIAAMTES